MNTHMQGQYSASIPLFLQDTILGFVGIFKAENINENIKICLEMFVKCINIELSRIVTMKNLNDILNDKGISKWEELLSNRELEIVDLLIKGLKDYQIEEKLFISKSTVRAHIGNIFEKLKVKSRLELIDKHYSYIIKEIRDILLKYEI
ncbi:response regulator transcription factor [Lysinibacillus sp. NPDC097279]|uniref:response regulator transcription factor n=1 Tax=Lysinibacillus sp. NPDC097279 TaxID=3364143 RepID=UPI0037F111FC